MTDLQQAICDIKANDLASVNFEARQWQIFVEHNSPLFDTVLKVKPTTPVNHHLLGLLTKSHIEALNQVEQHQSSARAMHQALNQELGKDLADNFHYHDGEQLIFITHLWLYLQGYLAMDFSLANDHAEKTASAIVSAMGGDIQQIRSAFMASFYQGKSHTNSTKPDNPLMAWIKSLFK